MFDRFTEHARRVIFFARYEAGSLGSHFIDTEHLLLGLLREDKVLPTRLPSGAGEQIRQRIFAGSSEREKISGSVDMPLSSDSKRALSLAAEQADLFHHAAIDSGHLILGLLKMEKCAAATLLHEFGVNYENYLESVGEQQLAPLAAQRPPLSESMIGPVTGLQRLTAETVRNLQSYSDSYANQRLKRKPWTRKEAFGHLIDWAVIHQQWFARALTEPNLAAESYPLDDWVGAQQYRFADFKELVDLWVALNRLIVHVMAQVPQEKFTVSCRIGVQSPIPLLKLIEQYVEHCEDIVGQILAHL
ncbi:MAG TPA: Clp protease N-terminal domain-containing protein [Bryobacteraceae bacterium]|nr:Clp protease N-terminal domain-containing protein [Bryobacteraceae bacterium]